MLCYLKMLYVCLLLFYVCAIGCLLMFYASLCFWFCDLVLGSFNVFKDVLCISKFSIAFSCYHIFI